MPIGLANRRMRIQLRICAISSPLTHGRGWPLASAEGQVSGLRAPNAQQRGATRQLNGKMTILPQRPLPGRMGEVMTKSLTAFAALLSAATLAAPASAITFPSRTTIYVGSGVYDDGGATAVGNAKGRSTSPLKSVRPGNSVTGGCWS